MMQLVAFRTAISSFVYPPPPPVGVGGGPSDDGPLNDVGPFASKSNSRSLVGGDGKRSSGSLFASFKEFPSGLGLGEDPFRCGEEDLLVLERGGALSPGASCGTEGRGRGVYSGGGGAEGTSELADALPADADVEELDAGEKAE